MDAGHRDQIPWLFAYGRFHSTLNWSGSLFAPSEAHRAKELTPLWFVVGVVLTVALLVTTSTPLPAAPRSGGYDHMWNVIAGGGLTNLSGGAYTLGATIGQWDTGVQSQEDCCRQIAQACGRPASLRLAQRLNRVVRLTIASKDLYV
jgi:hypothetical protein